MDTVKVLKAMVYDIFRLPGEKLEAIDGLARHNTAEAIGAIAEIERNWFLHPGLRKRARDILTKKVKII